MSIVPKGKLIRIYATVMAFYVFDFISTNLFCQNPDQEGMPFPRFFMKLTNNVTIGLFMNILLNAILWALVFFKLYSWAFTQASRSQNVKNIKFVNNLILLTPTVILASDFYAATSWYWNSLMAFLVGAILYLVSLIFWIRPFKN